MSLLEFEVLIRHPMGRRSQVDPSIMESRALESHPAGMRTGESLAL